MSCTDKDLEIAFNTGVEIFNANKDKTIANRLHPNVSIYSYNKHGNYSGIAAVEDYFEKEFHKGAKFYPTVPRNGYRVFGLSGKVTGTAHWTTEKPAHFIEFGFEFHFICEQDQWMFLNMDCFDPSK